MADHPNPTDGAVSMLVDALELFSGQVVSPPIFWTQEASAEANLRRAPRPERRDLRRDRHEPHFSCRFALISTTIACMSMIRVRGGSPKIVHVHPQVLEWQRIWWWRYPWSSVTDGGCSSGVHSCTND